MDSQTKIFFTIVLVCLLVGCGIVFFNKEYRVDKIYTNNQRYYPMVTDENIKRLESKFVFENSTAPVAGAEEE